MAAHVAQLVARYPIVAAALATRFPTIVCDEHQDSSADQHAIVMALLRQGARVRIFGDPMQHIYKDDAAQGVSPPCDWAVLVGQANAFADLDTPHRWSDGCNALGQWTLSARATLKAGGKIDFTHDLPASVSVAFAENIAQYTRLSVERREIGLWRREEIGLAVDFGAPRGKPATTQELAEHIVDLPDHRGVAAMLRQLAELKCSDSGFSDVAFDHHSEYWDAVRLGNFDDLEAGLAEITNRRTYSRPSPPAKAISTIHKAKGLECRGVILLAGDVKSFPEKPDARCLLYVALSRAKDRLHIVASRTTPSPLFIV